MPPLPPLPSFAVRLGDINATKGPILQMIDEACFSARDDSEEQQPSAAEEGTTNQPPWSFLERERESPREEEMTDWKNEQEILQ